MTGPVIELRGVNKTYRRLRKPPERAVRDLDLTVDAGGVFGFLGPNGSGKTTTIRMLLGLIRADSGTLRLLGHPVPAQLPAVIGRVGALVETPLFFPSFTARRNLAMLARASAIPLTKVEEILEFVALRERADERVKGFSLGMKQRLGIAAALLKDPQLLILDEPGNGLDAAGIREVRELIMQLGAGGVTVLLSSHQLTEVQQVCDRVAIMSRGAVVAQGQVSELLAARASGDVLVRVPDPAAAAQLLGAAGFTVAATDPVGPGGPGGPGGPVGPGGQGAPGTRLRIGAGGDPARITRVLSDGGIYLSELTPVSADLEDVFIDLTTPLGDAAGVGGGLHSADPAPAVPTTGRLRS